MTVCVAAICDNGGTIIGASDRMITSGGLIEFQSPERKVFRLTTSIIVMWSGDASFIRAILNELKAEIDTRVAAAPDEWLRVAQAALLLQSHYNDAVESLIEQNVLAPFGLTLQSFFKNQRRLDPEFVRELADRIRLFRPPEIAALVVGMDKRDQYTEAHIYEFENLYGPGNVHCHDAMGFHAIGSGGWHALSQLMLASYGPSKALSDALLLVYTAKKRAEVAPGVGPQTDMFWFAPRPDKPSAYDEVLSLPKTSIDKIYRKMKKREEGAIKTALQETHTWLMSEPPPKPPTGQSTLGPGTIIGDLPTE